MEEGFDEVQGRFIQTDSGEMLKEYRLDEEKTQIIEQMYENHNTKQQLLTAEMTSEMFREFAKSCLLQFRHGRVTIDTFSRVGDLKFRIFKFLQEKRCEFSFWRLD